MAVLPISCFFGCLLTLTILQLPTLDSAPFQVGTPQESVLALVGAEAELPCRVSPNASAEHAELRWIRHAQAPAVFLFRDGRAWEAEQMAEYRGRTTLAAGGPRPGLAALRIRGVRASDAGEYRCLFRDDAGSEETAVRLQVAALGSDPHISVDAQEDGQIRLQCTSSGWYPEPQVQWRAPLGATFPSTAESRSPDEEGLFTVASSVTLTDSTMENVSCCIQNLLLGQEKETELSIPASFLPRLTPWLVVMAILLVVLGLLTIGSVYFTWSLYKERVGQRKRGLGSNEKLLEELKCRKAARHQVDVTLDPDTAHPHLFLYGDSKSVRLEDSRQTLLDRPERFDCWPCVLGLETFTSGRHYWEVEVGDRTDWAIGVCREDVSKKGFDPMTPENGFWVVELYGSGYWALTSLRTPLRAAGCPRRVGVFLDCSSGLVAFYNITDGSHIYSFPSCSFSGPLRPVFCLWSCGKKPLTICPTARGSRRVPITADRQDLSKDALLSTLGGDTASGDTDTLRSKLIPFPSSHEAP